MMLSKAQYDALVSKFPAFMASKWPKLAKVWLCMAVYVYATDATAELASMVESL